MEPVGWLILLICCFTVDSLFFSLNGLALRTFSRVKLQQILKTARKKSVVDDLVESAEELILTCSVFSFIANIAIQF